jgi:hypothetical protein
MKTHMVGAVVGRWPIMAEHRTPNTDYRTRRIERLGGLRPSTDYRELDQEFSPNRRLEIIQQQ